MPEQVKRVDGIIGPMGSRESPKVFGRVSVCAGQVQLLSGAKKAPKCCTIPVDYRLRFSEDF